MNIEHLRDRLKIHEGFRPKPYRDSVGVLTIGYGLNLDEGITREEAEWLLESRIRRAVHDAAGLIPHWEDLSQLRQEVFANMAYNLGVGRLSGFRNMLKALDRKDFEWAADEMLDSKWARQVGRRADDLAFVMRHDRWP